MTTALAPIREDFRNRAAWLNSRRSCLGASDSPAIFGVGYLGQSPITVWDSKVNEPREEARWAESKRLKIGLLIQPALRAIFTEETGFTVTNPGDFTLVRHPEIPWLAASLDAEVEHPDFGIIPLELKNVSTFMRDEWDDEDPPLKHQVQVQHQIAVMGTSHGYLMGLIGGNEPVIKLVPRNERFIAVMLPKLEEFWGYVERRELPPVDSSQATAQLLARLYPESNGQTITLPEEAAEWDAELARAKADAKDAEERATKYANLIKASIGEATFGQLPGGCSYSWKEQTRKEHFVQESTFRVLRRCK
jgi:predicted phage-related endonuclease